MARLNLPLPAALILAAFLLAQVGYSQTQAPASSPDTANPTLRTTSRAVLVDVIVSDHQGHPVTGLKRDAFTITEHGKPQTISFFEEHTGVTPSTTAKLPKLPPNTFSNFSPFPAPDAVNVLLLDSLNTRMESQSFVHAQALRFLMSAKPGSHMAIFTMGLALHFVQGFSDDPAVLLAALNNPKNNEVQSSVMIKSQEETNAQSSLVGLMQDPNAPANPAMVAALKRFIKEQDTTQKFDRDFVTLTNLQRLATFLTAFPGRKNVIWFMESFQPLTSMDDNPRLENEYKKTMNMLAAARVALYPVDARGLATNAFYQADNQLPSSTSRPYQIIGVDSAPAGTAAAPNGSAGTPAAAPTAAEPGAQVSGDRQEFSDRVSDQIVQEMFAKDSGGKAFANTNGLYQVIDTIASTSSHFYTLSYSPANSKMDGKFRKIEVSVAGGKFTLSHRRGYYAEDSALPGAALTERNQQIKKLAADNPGAVDPLMPFMDLGMPQSTRIVYTTRIDPMPASASDAANGRRIVYGINFLIDFRDVDLELEPNGNHQGKLNLSLIAYDRYGNIASRKDHIVNIDVKPDVYAIFQKNGVMLHDEIGVPKGQFWLRTGIYDQATQQVGTLEIPLSTVKSLTASSR